MAVVVCVHGVGKQQLGEASLLRDWLPALRDGMTRADPSVTVADSDVGMAFYGDLFLASSRELAGPDPYFDQSSVEPGLETELLMEWWEAAAAVDPQVVAPDAEDTLAGVPRSVQRALLSVAQSRFFGGMSERALIFDLKQTRRYLAEPTLREAARARVRMLIGPETRVVVAHSLGSLVAYEALCSMPGHTVEAFVTLGSPLGIRRLIFDRVEPPPVNGRGVRPGAESLRWTNVADDHDVVALVKDLRPLFGDDVACHIVPNGSHAHDATHYLTKAVTGAAITKALS